MRILIVEDDLLTATNLKEGLAERGYDDLEISRSYINALERFKQYAPDLVLLDINLGKETPSGIELAREFNNIQLVPIIFVTGERSEETIRRAVAVRPANYMVKPIDLNALTGNIDLALINFSKKHTPNDNDEKPPIKLSMGTILQRDDTIFVKSRDRFEKRILGDILWVQADNVYTSLHYIKEKIYVLSMPLKRFEEQVKASNLIKVNRSQIINIDHVDSFESNRIFIGNQDFRVTEKFKQHFLDSFQPF